jgi:hypothetical protein
MRILTQKMSMKRSITVLILSIPLLCSPVFAQDSESDSSTEPVPPEGGANDQDDSESDPGTLPTDSEAEQMPTLSRAQHRWLDPKRSRLPQVPHAQTDFSAYTLEWGETKIGLATITVGALPRLQIGTVPVLDILGVPNGNIKLNAVRAGPYALGIGASHYRLKVGEFVGTTTGVSLIQSVQILQPWSLHVGARFRNLRSSGVPDTSQLPSILTGGTDPDTFAQSQEGNEGAWRFHGQSIDLSMATDIRFNRRDSLIIRGGATFWTNVLERGFEAPPILGLDEAFNVDTGTSAPIAESYVASIAWQWSWRRVDLRVGAGVSNVPGAWILQCTDLSYRFGGKTRTTERRMKRTWKRNKSDTQRR